MKEYIIFQSLAGHAQRPHGYACLPQNFPDEHGIWNGEPLHWLFEVHTFARHNLKPDNEVLCTRCACAHVWHGRVWRGANT